jgi:hypothetical protein
MSPGRRPSGPLGSGTRGWKLRRAARHWAKPSALLILLVVIVGAAAPLLLSFEDGQQAGAIFGGLNDPYFPTDPSVPSDGGEVPEPGTSPGEEIDVGDVTSNLTVRTGDGSYTVLAEEYSITVSQQGRFVDYCIRPYFTDDVINYRRADPVTAADGTVDQYGNDLNGVTTTITDWGQDGNVVWFLESCEQFSLRQSFTVYRDYFELNVTYIPGTANVITGYFIGLYSAQGSLYDMFADGAPHRYIPGVPVDTPASNGIGGWFPAYPMFAPAFDMRAPGSTLGVEWGFNEAEAYIYSPVWMKDMGGGGASVFEVKYTSTDSILPNPELGSEQTWHMFVRPYQYTDGQPRGHDAGYAQWVAPLIAQEYDTVHTEQFPLTFNDFGQNGQWDSAIRSFVESSPITVATLSTNPDQIDWHYKSAQRTDSPDGTMPTDWQLWSGPNAQYYASDGDPVADAASAAYRDHLINGDPYNDWWWSSTGVYWDEMNSWYGENNLPRSDYNEHQDFIYDGYIKLAEESRASGHWSFVITNAFTAQIQLAMVSDLAAIEGFEPVPSYNMDLRSIVISTMLFVDEMPEQYRPHILVYQNYDADSAADQGAVYQVLFDAARYGFCVDLLSYASYSAQLHNLQMAVDMFTAMGAGRHNDPTIVPATLDMDSEGQSTVTDAQMVVLKGSGTPTVTFTAEHESYSLTNLRNAPTTFDVVLPGGTDYAVQGSGITLTGEVTPNADGTVALHGTIAAEATGYIVPAP